MCIKFQVNIADALEFLSAGYLRSTVHRVIRPPEDQASRPRLSLIYFARPEANIILKPVDSPLLKRLGVQAESEEFTKEVTAEGGFRFNKTETRLFCPEQELQAAYKKTDVGV